jgi:hypothetical protein
LMVLLMVPPLMVPGFFGLMVPGFFD